MLWPPTVTASASGRRRAPPQVEHGRIDMNVSMRSFCSCDWVSR